MRSSFGAIVIIMEAETPPHPAAARRAAVARAMNALSHPRRAEIFEELSDAGSEGLAFESLISRTGFSVAVLAHHLKPMLAAGVVRKRRRGVHVVYRVDAEHLVRAFEWIDGGLTRAAA